MESKASISSANKGNESTGRQLPPDQPAENASSEPRGQKRKWDNKGQRQQHGSKRNKGRDMGRQEYFRQKLDRRQRNENEQNKRSERRRDDPNAKQNPFTAEEIESDTRQPKRKVAVMMGYAGSGYKGMQMMPNQRTIEGDLFAAFVKAGAISKANADDPKKSSFVRCARTDKGVHAAGNVISLKLIIEDPKIVDKINENLPQQIRVWGIERAVGSFSCYQACDSRWYEYLIPTHCFLPPHPTSYMGTKLVELAEEVGDLENYKKRQEEVEGFWEKVEAEQIKPILDGLDEELRAQVEQALYHTSTDEITLEDEEEPEQIVDEGEPNNASISEATSVEVASIIEGNELRGIESESGDVDGVALPKDASADDELASGAAPEQTPGLRNVIKSLKDAYLLAKRQWRISPARLARVQQAFATYKGTNNFHNYTIRKSFKDPSAKRHIISFKVNPTPIIIGDTEWLSLKVHGQSFMMHQIRKMVGMAALVVRCGSEIEKTMTASFKEELYAIPKAPALGLLLERPVFDSYNAKATAQFDRAEVAFGKYEEAMEEFKRKEIYERIFGEEEMENVFHSFFTHVDNFRTPTFLYLSSKGLIASGDPRNEPTTKSSMSRKERFDFSRQRGRARDPVSPQENGEAEVKLTDDLNDTEKAVA